MVADEDVEAPRVGLGEPGPAVAVVKLLLGPVPARPVVLRGVPLEDCSLGSTGGARSGTRSVLSRKGPLTGSLVMVTGVLRLAGGTPPGHAPVLGTDRGLTCGRTVGGAAAQQATGPTYRPPERATGRRQERAEPAL
ncbi:hypothetical protein GCM10009844_26150 [Nocardioides koreensis]|uniref:Uncharacterized protein n=1 Tax=Nocardioides koreensis TaxID=433651 RepID=A0ABN2ZUX4_9ACTN